MVARSFPALGFDPTPGSVASAESVAEQVRTTAARIREAADVLGGTGRQDWQGETATAFHETMSGELTPRVATAADSFEAAAAALETWATSLVTFQHQADDLETRAATAIAAVSNATEDLSAAQQSEDPDVDTDGPSNQLSAATAELEQIRAEAHGLAEIYAGEAEYVASCLSCAADDAPDSSMWDKIAGGFGAVEDWFQDYVLPVLEDIIDIVVVVVAVAAVIALIASPLGWAALAGMATVLGKAAFWLSVGALAVDGAQVLGGRKDGSEFATGLAGLALGGALGGTLSGLKSIASSGGFFGGQTAALAGAYGGTGGSAMVGALGIQWSWVNALAGGGYVAGKAYDQTKSVYDTAQGVNDVGSPLGRMGERIGSLFSGDGFTTAEQRRDIADRKDEE